MIRENTAPGARNIAVLIVPDRDQQVPAPGASRRRTAPPPARPSAANSAIPEWVRLERTGSTFRSCHSDNGTTWTEIGTRRHPGDAHHRPGRPGGHQPQHHRSWSTARSPTSSSPPGADAAAGAHRLRGSRREQPGSPELEPGGRGDPPTPSSRWPASSGPFTSVATSRRAASPTVQHVRHRTDQRHDLLVRGLGQQHRGPGPRVGPMSAARHSCCGRRCATRGPGQLAPPTSHQVAVRVAGPGPAERGRRRGRGHPDARQRILVRASDGAAVPAHRRTLRAARDVVRAGPADALDPNTTYNVHAHRGAAGPDRGAVHAVHQQLHHRRRRDRRPPTRRLDRSTG